jgi:protein TonB
MQLCRSLHHKHKEVTMKNPNWLIHSMDDIIFEGRNQAYGAFLLRRLYEKHMTRAMIVGVLFFLLAVSSPKIIQLIKGYMPENQDDLISHIYTLADPPPIKSMKPPPPKPPEVKPRPIKDQIKFVPPIVVKDEDEKVEIDPVPTVDQFQGNTIGSESKDGDDEGLEVPLEGTEPFASPVTEVIVEDDEPFTFVEQMPSFPGGIEAMYKYIYSNIDYPAIARQNRISGKVVIQFVVSREGEIQNARVVIKIGGGCDVEALRVVNSMPRWKPGMHNGRAVPVTFTLPIKFVLQ